MGYREKYPPSRLKHPSDLLQRRAWVRGVFEDVLHDHDLELTVRKRELGQSAELGSKTQLAAIVDGVCADIDSGRPQPEVRGCLKGVAAGASDIEERAALDVVEDIENL